jgi:hypothetical protein
VDIPPPPPVPLLGLLNAYVEGYRMDEALMDEEDKDELIEVIRKMINSQHHHVTNSVIASKDFKNPYTGEKIPNLDEELRLRFDRLLGEAAIELNLARNQLVLEQKQRAKEEKLRSNNQINIYGHNLGSIQQGGQNNTQSSPPSFQSGVEKESPKEESANKLYDQVVNLTKDWDAVDEVKAQLIIEYAKDAIEDFGKTNQDKKVELRRLIDKAEHVTSPDSIDTFKKRAEKTVLRFVYPKNLKLRNTTLLIIGILTLAVLILPFLLGSWNLKNKLVGKLNEGGLGAKSKIVIIVADTTSSLSPTENEKVATIAVNILDSLPINTKYAIYPIQNDPQRGVR